MTAQSSRIGCRTTNAGEPSVSPWPFAPVRNAERQTYFDVAQFPPAKASTRSGWDCLGAQCDRVEAFSSFHIKPDSRKQLGNFVRTVRRLCRRDEVFVGWTSALIWPDRAANTAKSTVFSYSSPWAA